MDITALEWAYLAGIIDADGCIRIFAEKRKRAPSAINVLVTNGDASLVRWLRDKLGGRVYARGPQRCWNVSWTAKKAVSILEGIYPFLIIKREQARLTMDFQALLLPPRCRGRGHVLGDADLAKRYALIEAASILKRKKEEV